MEVILPLFGLRGAEVAVVDIGAVEDGGDIVVVVVVDDILPNYDVVEKQKGKSGRGEAGIYLSPSPKRCEA